MCIRDSYREFLGDQISGKVAFSILDAMIDFATLIFAYGISFLPWTLLLALLTVGSIRAGAPRAVTSWLIGWMLLIPIVFSFSTFSPVRYLIPALPAAAVLLALGFSRCDPAPHLRVTRDAFYILAGATLCLALLSVIMVGQAVSIGAGLTLLLAALLAIAAAWSLGRRNAALAPVSVGLLPLIGLACAFPAIAALVLPDVGKPLAERMASSGVPQSARLFVGDDTDGSEVRIHSGEAFAFDQAETLVPAALERYALIATTDGEVARTLAVKGYQVDTVRGGWRKIDAADLWRAVLSGTLASAIAENGEAGYIAELPASSGAAAAEQDSGSAR